MASCPCVATSDYATQVRIEVVIMQTITISSRCLILFGFGAIVVVILSLVLLLKSLDTADPAKIKASSSAEGHWRTATILSDLKRIEQLAEESREGLDASFRVPASARLLRSACPCTSTTPILWAIRFNDNELFDCLLRVGVDPAQRDACGWSPVDVAAASNRVAMLQDLVGLIGDYRCLYEGGWNPRWLAAAYDCPDVLLWIHEIESDMSEVERPDRGVMQIVVEERALSSLEALLEVGADPGVEDRADDSPLRIAMRRRFSAGALALIDAGASLESNDPEVSTTLVLAIKAGMVDVVDRMLELGVDFTASGGGVTALGAAAGAGQIEIVQRLLDLGVDANDSTDGASDNAILRAATACHADVCELLLKAGADPNVRDSMGATPIASCLMYGNDPDGATVRVLLAHGADPLICDEDGLDALFYAAIRGSFASFQALADHVPSEVVDSRRNELYDEALHHPVAEDGAKIMRYLRDFDGQQ